MTNISVITRSHSRYLAVSKSIELVSPKLSFNKFFNMDVIKKFKRNQWMQFLYPLPNLLIIDQDNLKGEDLYKNPSSILTFLLSLKLFNEKTKILVLIEENIKNDYCKFPFFVFSDKRQVNDNFLENLSEKIREILLE